MAGVISGTPSFSTGFTVPTSQLITVDTINNTTSNAGVAVQGKSGSGLASAGYVGEIISSSFSAVSLTTLSALTSISLTAGAWDISAFAILNSTGSTFTLTASDVFLIGTVSASITGGVAGVNLIRYVAIAGSLASGTPAANPTIPSYRVNLASTTTHYLNMDCASSVSTPTVTGILRATRVL